MAIGSSTSTRSASKHLKLDLPVFGSSIRQTIASHLLYSVPVLTEISRRLLLRRKFRLYAARLARVTVRDLKEYRLLAFADFPCGWRPVAHRLLPGPWSVVFNFHCSPSTGSNVRRAGNSPPPRSGLPPKLRREPASGSVGSFSRRFERFLPASGETRKIHFCGPIGIFPALRRS
jgi:hypothetical protein